ncbi:MAG TPA: FAD-dependent oxidoreductase [Gemmatimonadaceae bacterium]|nr:FAD-dependent oxidoreductase [Gemmatimonadaceae bacterium]
MSDPRILILGAGPAGLGAALQLHRRGRGHATVIEQHAIPGGNASSFPFGGQRLDYGSHRLHPSSDPDILADIKGLLGDDLLDRPRHGRIRLRGKWIHFPLKPADLLLRLDKGFAISSSVDMARKALGLTGTPDDNFAGVLWNSLGPTICRDFYFPYARKIWGLEPEKLSAVQARKRVKASSFGGLMKKVFGALPGLKKPGTGRFFYPRQGFGQICDAYAAAAQQQGASILYSHRVEQVIPPSTDRAPWTVLARGEHGTEQLQGDYLWSTIPITAVASAYQGEIPASVPAAAAAIRYRAMILVYVQLDVEQFTEYDAHYLPEAGVKITRLSEPKNYRDAVPPTGKTVLCAELPCEVDDEVWRLDDAALGRLVAADLQTVGLPLARPPIAVFTRRLKQAYPIYLTGYQEHFNALDQWADSLPRFLTYGRQGLFAHDNTHHALRMAYAAVECMGAAGFDEGRWREYRRDFETHVVED